MIIITKNSWIIQGTYYIHLNTSLSNLLFTYSFHNIILFSVQLLATLKFQVCYSLVQVYLLHLYFARIFTKYFHKDYSQTCVTIFSIHFAQKTDSQIKNYCLIVASSKKKKTIRKTWKPLELSPLSYYSSYKKREKW